MQFFKQKVLLFTFNTNLSEFRECIPKVENNMDNCRNCCQMLRNVIELFEIEKMMHYAIHLLNSLLNARTEEAPCFTPMPPPV